MGTLWPLIDQSTAREMSQHLSGSADWPFWINLINLVTLPFCCQSSKQNVKRKLAPLLQVVRKYKHGDQTLRSEKPLSIGKIAHQQMASGSRDSLQNTLRRDFKYGRKPKTLAPSASYDYWGQSRIITHAISVSMLKSLNKFGALDSQSTCGIVNTKE